MLDSYLIIKFRLVGSFIIHIRVYGDLSNKKTLCDLAEEDIS